MAEMARKREKQNLEIVTRPQKTRYIVRFKLLRQIR